MSAQWTDFTGQFADGLLDEAGKLQDEAGEAFDNFATGASSKAVDAWFNDVRNKADQTAKDIAGKAAEGPKIKPSSTRRQSKRSKTRSTESARTRCVLV